MNSDIEKLLKIENSWDIIKSSGKPVVLYGMGNGADMIIDELQKIGVEFADIFASDEFVRGHYFHGKKVLRYSEICEKYDDFIAVLTFAVHDKKSMEHIRDISRERTLLSLTVPVAGSGLFTTDFLKENLEKIDKVYDFLADDLSKKTYLDVIKFKLSGDIEYLYDCYSEKAEIYENIFSLSEDEVFMDLGAYDGDTVKEFIDFSGGKYKKIIALEPDKKNYKRLEKNTLCWYNVYNYNLGAWNCDTRMFFDKKSGRQSRLSDNGNDEVQLKAVDSFDEPVSFLKMDIEGSEKAALKGAEKTIKKYHPKLYVCAYHRNDDIFTLPLMIKDFDEKYKLYFRQHPYIPAWECNFYAD